MKWLYIVGLAFLLTSCCYRPDLLGPCVHKNTAVVKVKP